jgi:hypothetical protein
MSKTYTLESLLQTGKRRRKGKNRQKKWVNVRLGTDSVTTGVTRGERAKDRGREAETEIR